MNHLQATFFSTTDPYLRIISESWETIIFEEYHNIVLDLKRNYVESGVKIVLADLKARLSVFESSIFPSLLYLIHQLKDSRGSNFENNWMVNTSCFECLFNYLQLHFCDGLLLCCLQDSFKRCFLAFIDYFLQFLGQTQRVYSFEAAETSPELYQLDTNTTLPFFEIQTRNKFCEIIHTISFFFRKWKMRKLKSKNLANVELLSLEELLQIKLEFLSDVITANPDHKTDKNFVHSMIKRSEQLISKISSIISARMWKLLLNKEKLQLNFNFIHKIMLLGDGSFWTGFIESNLNLFYSSNFSDLSIRFDEFLQQNLPDFSGKIKFVVDENSQNNFENLFQISLISFEKSEKWPWNLIFDKRSMEVYSSINKLLFESKKAICSLNIIFKLLMQNRKKYAKVQLVWILRMKLQFFCSTYAFHANMNVIDVEMTKLKHTEFLSFEHLRSSHTHLVDKLEYSLLFQKNQQIIMDLYLIFQIPTKLLFAIKLDHEEMLAKVSELDKLFDITQDSIRKQFIQMIDSNELFGKFVDGLLRMLAK